MGIFKKATPEPRARPTQRLDYPDGIAVNTEKANYYIKNKKKFKFFSDRVFDTWNLAPAYGSEASLSHFTRGGVLGFRDGSLIQDYGDGKLYIIAGNKRRLILSPDVLDLLGYEDNMIIVASSEELGLHNEGESIGWHITQ